MVEAWNSLPENIVNAATLNGFKIGLDAVWTKKIFTTRNKINK